MGHRLLGRPPRPRPRGDARLPRSGAGARDRGDGPQPAVPPARRPHGRRRATIAAGSGRARPTSPSSRCRAPRSARRVAALPGHVPDPEPDEGPRPGDRRPALDPRRRTGPSRCSPARTSPRRSHGAARGRGDRRRGPRALGAAPARHHVADVPRLRQRRRRGRRAVRGGEERDRARRRRGRRARARRQREGGARRARARRDGAASPRRPARGPRRSPGSPGWAT